MSSRDDDRRAYTTSDGMYGRAFRRGVRKGLKAVTMGLLGGGGTIGGTAKGAAQDLAGDAAREYRVMRERSKRHGT